MIFKSNMQVPLEDKEAESLAVWLRMNKYKFSHIWNESGQAGTKNIIIMMAKKKRLGVSPWFPDFCIVLKRWALLFIELKRQKIKLKSGKLWASPSKVSDEQKQWVEILGGIDNVMAKICYWWQDAKEYIQIIENF